MSDPIVPVEIYNSKGEALDETTNYPLNSGDYIECRSKDPINSNFPPKYLWWKDRTVTSSSGPTALSYQNTDEEYNRYINQVDCC